MSEIPFRYWLVVWVNAICAVTHFARISSNVHVFHWQICVECFSGHKDFFPNHFVWLNKRLWPMVVGYSMINSLDHFDSTQIAVVSYHPLSDFVKTNSVSYQIHWIHSFAHYAQPISTSTTPCICMTMPLVNLLLRLAKLFPRLINIPRVSLQFRLVAFRARRFGTEYSHSCAQTTFMHKNPPAKMQHRPRHLRLESLANVGNHTTANREIFGEFLCL